jgi:hypothetical protein
MECIGSAHIYIGSMKAIIYLKYSQTCHAKEGEQYNVTNFPRTHPISCPSLMEMINSVACLQSEEKKGTMMLIECLSATTLKLE